LATDTDKQMDRPIALSRSRCRERWLNNTVPTCSWIWRGL